MSETYIFNINGMTCGVCSGSIESYLKNQFAERLKNFHADITTSDPKNTIIVLADDQKIWLELKQLIENDEERKQKKVWIELKHYLEACIQQKQQNVWSELKHYLDKQREWSELKQYLEAYKQRKHQEVWSVIKQYIDDVGFECEQYDPRKNQGVWLELKSDPEDVGYDSQDHKSPPIEKIKPTQPQKISIYKKLKAKGKQLFTSHWFLGGLGCLAGIAVLIICLATTGLGLPAMISLALFSVALTVILGANSYNDAWSKLTKSGTLTMDSLFALSTISILVVSVASLFVPWLPMMFEAGLLIYGFRHIGIAIEDTIKEKIGSAKFQDRAAKRVKRQTIDGIEEVNLEQVEPGDVILVNPGEIIPLDGFCMEESIIYNTIITGATLPRHFTPQQKVLAGMRMADNAIPLKIRVSKTYAKSYLARLDAAIEKSALEKAPIEIKTGRILAYFIPTVIALAIFSGAIIAVFFPAAIAIQCAVSILVSACPCTLALITPLAVKTGMHKAAENGVQFRSAKTLQEAEQIDTIIFDLNGTLTTGVPKVRKLHLSEESRLSEADLLSLCAALEKKSTHPIGKAIYSYANQHGAQKLKVSMRDDSHHSGITGQIDGEHYTIGSMTLMQEKGIHAPSNMKPPVLDAGDHVVSVARGNTIIGYMVMTDPLRDDAFSTIQALMAMGKEIHLCTGADEETAQRYAQALGIKKIRAGCVATGKTAYINYLKKQGHKVAMIGDAANDAQAIAASDFSIAIASDGGDELTQQAAGAVVHTGHLLPIVSAFAVSKQAVANINQNLYMSLGYNLAAIIVSAALLMTLGIPLSPVAGVVLMIVQACIILLNVYRFKQQPLEHLKEETQEHQESCFPNSTSHLKMHRHTPACTHDRSFEQLPDLKPQKNKPVTNKSASYPFWSYFTPEESESAKSHVDAMTF